MIDKEIRIEVRGRVQGIRFREKVKKKALELNLKGFVMNKEDGDVSIIAQGNEVNLDDFFRWIQSGPGFAKIEGLKYSKENLGKKYPHFSIIKEKNFFLDQAQSFFNLGKRIFGFDINVKVPEHVAIIPDGNRRWARKKGFDGTFGHYKSASYDNLDALFKESKKIGIKFLSLWGFSTENWKRSEIEKKEIFDVISSGVERFNKECNKNKIKFKHIGRKDRLPKELINLLKKLEAKSAIYKDFTVLLCLDYGGRDELIRAVNNVLKSGRKRLNEEEFSLFLDTAGVPDPDLIIRTSGEKRMSGLMPFQAVYAELYFSELNFPDFDVKEFRKAIKEFGHRQRRFGGSEK